MNVRAAHEPVPVDPRFFALVAQARELSEITDGAFDITVAPLLQAWGFVGANGRMPEAGEIEAARARVGMSHVITNADDFTIQFDREGVLLDFGAIGKGYAIERAAAILREYEIESALLHGGTSTVYALGHPPDSEAWTVAIQSPPDISAASEVMEIPLCDAALSVSAPHGKAFQSQGRQYGHVLDPRTGAPTPSDNLLAALVCDSPTESDALSTALLTLGPDWLPTLAQLRPHSKSPCRALGRAERRPNRRAQSALNAVVANRGCRPPNSCSQSAMPGH